MSIKIVLEFEYSKNDMNDAAEAGKELSIILEKLGEGDTALPWLKSARIEREPQK